MASVYGITAALYNDVLYVCHKPVQSKFTWTQYVSISVYLYGVGLVMLDRLPAPQRSSEGELRGGRGFISFFWPISPSARDLLSSHRLVRLDLHPSLWISLRVVRCLLFLLLLLFLLGVGVSFSLAVLSQLERETGRWKFDLYLKRFSLKVKNALANT